MNRLVALLLRTGIRRGLLGGSRSWLIVGGAAATVRVLQKLAGSGPEVVYSGQLEPGQTVIIASGRPD